MKKLFLFFIPFLFISNVFAQDFDVSNEITSPFYNGSNPNGRYAGTEIYYNGTQSTYSINTRYQGRLSKIIYNLPSDGYDDADGFEKNTTYTITMNMATEDWRNKFGGVSVKCEGSSGTELSNGNVTYISYKKIKFSFKTPSSTYCQFVYVTLSSTNTSSVSFTGETNWNLKSIIKTNPNYSSGSSGSGSSSTPTPTPSTATNQDIINNQNSNTQNIINSQNSNTENIINNQNSNTQDIIENANSNTNSIILNTLLTKVNNERNNYDVVANNCGMLYTYDLGIGKSFYSGGVEYEREGYFYVSDYIPLNGATKLSFEGFNDVCSSDTGILILYDSNKQRIDHWSMCNRFVSIDPNSVYFRYATKFPLGRIFKDKQCTNPTVELTDTVKDSNLENGVGSDFFEDFTENSHGLSGIITIPLQAIQNLANNQCQTLTIPLPFTGNSITLPCMTEYYEEHIPTLYALLQTIIYGFMAYRILIDIFSMVKGFKDPDNDKIEVLDL